MRGDSKSMKHIPLIKTFEGFSPKKYICPAGYSTIGYGHLIKNGENFPEFISEKEAENLLILDCKKFEPAVLKLIKAPLNENQFSALISFVFNLGAGALQSSTLRQKLNRLEYISAASEFPRWVYAGGKRLKGLLIRRLAEQKLFLSV